MNRHKQYLIDKLHHITREFCDTLRLQTQQEDICFLPVGILLMKWIVDSEERFNWHINNELKELFLDTKLHDILYGSNYIERLIELVAELEENNPVLAGIFTTLCLSYLNHVNEKYLKDIIYAYSQFKFDDEHIDEGIGGLFFESFLQSLSEDSNTYSFITPKSISEIVSKLFNLREYDRIADITAGTCGILNEVAKEYHKNKLSGDNIYLYGQDINFKTVLIGKINLLLHGIKDFEIVAKDTLRQSVLKDSTIDIPFKLILSNLPLGLNWDRYELEYTSEFKYDFPNKVNADWLFIQRAIAALEKCGKAAFIVSKGTLTRASETHIRKKIILEEDLIEAVISLPANLYGSKTMPVEILIINKNKEQYRKNKIFFIDASKEYNKKDRGRNELSNEHINKIITTYHKWNEIDNYSKIISIEEIIDNEFRLDSTRYINTQLMPSGQSKTVKLKEVAEIRRGLQVLKTDTEKEVVAEDKSHYYIKISDINEGNIAFTEQIKYIPENKIAAYELKPNDIIISARGVLIKTAIYEENMPPSIISGNIMFIRTNKNYNPYFLKYYLDSPKVRELIQNMQGGSTITALNHSKFQELLVPDISIDIQNKLAERIKQNEVNYKSIIEHAKRMYEQNLDIINNEIFENYIVSE